MGAYILCQAKKAGKPYFIENISTNIYSIEELCYYLYNNLYLVDNTIINEGLCKWLEEELEMESLAAKLRPHLGKFSSAEDILYPVLKEINYLTYEELRSLNVRLAKLDAEPPVVREKQKGDALVENGMYVGAIHVYEKLLESPELKYGESGLKERVYHNLGCVHSYLFQMEKALECFEKAYILGGSKSSLKIYLLAFYSIRTPIEYENKLKELSVSEELRREIQETLKDFAKIPEKKVSSDQIDSVLEDFTREYHRSTGS